MQNKIKYALFGFVFVILTIIGYFIMPKTDEVSIVSSEVNNDIYVHIDGQIKVPRLKES